MGTPRAYLKGERLIGDDFTTEELCTWYGREKEGCANLGAKNKGKYAYIYHNVNEIYGYAHLPKERFFDSALGIGSAYGDEFLPIIERIGELHIIEPSVRLWAEHIGQLTPVYHMPEVNSAINQPDASVDLITCFSTLHHIPNVSFVFSDMCRCLKPGGFLLIKEPITSMGDWSKPRPALTLNERGIPLDYF